MLDKLVRPADAHHLGIDPRIMQVLENRGAECPGRREFRFVPAGCVPPELGDNFYREPKAVAIGYEPDGSLSK